MQTSGVSRRENVAVYLLFEFESRSLTVIASEAKQSSFLRVAAKLDCFVARAPRNDGERAETHKKSLPSGGDGRLWFGTQETRGLTPTQRLLKLCEGMGAQTPEAIT